MIDYIEEIVKELNEVDLIEFLGIYDSYIQNFYTLHDAGSTPVSIVEFYNNDYKELLDKWEVFIYTDKYKDEEFAEYCENMFIGYYNEK